MPCLVFDYDGTLHNSMLTYAPAFRATMKQLADEDYLPQREYSDSDISYWLGFNSADMWSNFAPDLDPQIRERARTQLGEDMAQRVERGEGALFPHTQEVLAELKKRGYTLIFLSNCRIHYMERHRRVFGLDKWFDFFYCCEEFGFIPKHEIFRQIAPHHDGPFIIIGDRFHDIEIAAENGLPSIGCGYGYGTPDELAKADVIVSDIRQIPDTADKLLKEV